MNITEYEDLANEPGIERLYFEFAITGGAGAVGAINKQRGFRKTTPFVRNSAGNYSLFLDEGVFEIVHVAINLETSAGGAVTAGAATVVRVVGRTPGGATPNVNILCTSALATPVATDPASGDIICGHVAIKNTNA